MRALVALAGLLVWASPRVEAAVVLAHVSFAHHHDHHGDDVAARDGHAGERRGDPGEDEAPRSALAIALHGHAHPELVPEHEHRIAGFGQALVLKGNDGEATVPRAIVVRPDRTLLSRLPARGVGPSRASLYAHCSLRL